MLRKIGATRETAKSAAGRAAAVLDRRAFASDLRQQTLVGPSPAAEGALAPTGRQRGPQTAADGYSFGATSSRKRRSWPRWSHDGKRIVSVSTPAARKSWIRRATSSAEPVATQRSSVSRLLSVM